MSYYNLSGRQVGVCDDLGTTNSADISFLGQTKKVPHVTPYGVYTSPPVGSAWILVPLRDNEDDLVGIGCDYAGREKGLLQGELMLYNTLTKAKFKFDESGNVIL